MAFPSQRIAPTTRFPSQSASDYFETCAPRFNTHIATAWSTAI